MPTQKHDKKRGFINPLSFFVKGAKIYFLASSPKPLYTFFSIFILMNFSEDEYRLDFFMDEGFQRKKCEKCGKFFWSRDAQRNTCGDHPCDPYTFIGSPIFNRKYNMAEMREKYLTFFSDRGHTRIRRYPTLANWRDDIYLTIASIAVFQPHVTSGQVPPPANPLTISQPCIRLDDLDSVGRSGRHLTTFEMMAHHVFNTRDREIYWKDRTVQLCDEFLLELGTDPLAITYKENPWAGGGNAGPSVEVMVGGLELATLVFMGLKTSDRGSIQIGNDLYEKMDNYIVDTGYGLERFVWASNGSPTVYDAIFPDTIKILSDSIGNNINQDILEKIYIISDHTRCLAYMLGDGIIPSNVKSGYLARLIMRRTIQCMNDINSSIPLSDLVEYQISKLDYSDWRTKMSQISDIISSEEKKYDRIIKSGPRHISRLHSKYPNFIPYSEIINLYEVHGIPIDISKSIANSMGIEIRNI